MKLHHGALPRWVQVGPLILDLLYRDARLDDRWLHLNPRLFELLWRFAESPRERLTRQTLLRDVWRLNHEPETNSLEVHIYRLRKRLAVHGFEAMIVTDPLGGYRLDADVRSLVIDSGLDSHTRISDEQATVQDLEHDNGISRERAGSG